MSLQDLVAGHSCSCVAGFSGSNCEVNIDDCQTVNCSGNGVCQDEVATFTCVCQPEYTGQLCEQLLSDTDTGAQGNVEIFQ